MKKAILCYKNFISNIKKHRTTIQPEFVNDHVWERWMELWQSDDCVKKSEINSKNQCGGHEVAAGTHNGGSVTAGEHKTSAASFILFFQQAVVAVSLVFPLCFATILSCYSLLFPFYFAAIPTCLALKIGRDPTPSELHLHVHTHNHNRKSFFGERFRLLHERYEEIIWEKIQCESEIDQLETYYEAAGGAKKKRLFGLGSEATIPPSISLPITNMEELVKQLIPALTTHFLPIVIERVGGTRVQDRAVLDPTPTDDNDDDVDS
ncbi:uncharacterized protein LOC124897625 [Capsicum annuum]|uniref:uncharacterized protein LOC124897625 n=1 Tax=Capsicum annuum TaxID=4072 RepID=UPI001FB0A4B4|nr:uncharacterized protein LOC124897625 [Capsicum annuum]